MIFKNYPYMIQQMNIAFMKLVLGKQCTPNENKTNPFLLFINCKNLNFFLLQMFSSTCKLLFILTRMEYDIQVVMSFSFIVNKKFLLN